MDEYQHVREAFREVALGLMEWREPADITPREYRRLEGFPPRADDRDIDSETERRHDA